MSKTAEWWVLVVAFLLLGTTCYYKGKRTADRWYAAHPNVSFAGHHGICLSFNPEADTVSPNFDIPDCLDRSYVEKQIDIYAHKDKF